VGARGRDPGRRQWWHHEFSFGGNNPVGLVDGSPPVRSRGEAPVGAWGQSPAEAEVVCSYCLQILTAETITIYFLTFSTIHPSFLTSLFHDGLSDIMLGGGLVPKTIPGAGTH